VHSSTSKIIIKENSISSFIFKDCQKSSIVSLISALSFRIKIATMQFKASLISAFAALFAASQASFTVPPDTPNGHYRVQLDEHGNALGAPLKLSDITSKRSVIEVRQFPNPSIGCNGYAINLSDFSVTAAGLDAWCDAGNQVNPHTVEYWMYQTSLAYICNYASGLNPRSSYEYNSANTLEDDDCGAGNAGWVYIGDWGKSYGRANLGVSVC
jgi:hypothetical protein